MGLGKEIGWSGPPESRQDLTSATPQAEPDPILDNYMLLVVVMSLFVGGTLVVLSGVLLLCRRCWEVHQGFNRCVPTTPLLSRRPGRPWSPAGI